MCIKKILLLASMAVVVVALAAPTMASAAELTIRDNGKPLDDHSIKFTGQVEFTSLGTGFNCTVHTTLTVSNDENYITEFEITTKTCEFYGFLYERCEFEEKAGDTVTKLPWLIDITGADTLTLTGSIGGGPGIIDMRLQGKPGKECFTTNHNLTISDITIDVETVEGFIDALQLTGEVLVDDETGLKTPLYVHGTLPIEKTKTKTYKIGS